MTLSLDAIAASARQHRRIATTRAARAAQRAAEEAELADYYARRREQRLALERALAAPEMDLMRFRWLCDHSERAGELVGMDSDQIRRAIDLWQRQEAAARITEMHNSHYAATA